MYQNSENIVSSLAELENEIEHAPHGTSKTIYIDKDIEITYSVEIQQSYITLKPSSKSVKICRTNSVNSPKTGLFDVVLGGLTIAGADGFTLTIEGNKDKSNNQPLIHCYNCGQFTLQKNGILQNNITDNGGAVYVGEKSDFIMEGGSIRGNEARCNGGAIYVDLDGAVYIKEGFIENNIAGGNGGGIYFRRSHPYLRRCASDISGGHITQNTAGLGGGGVYYDVPACTQEFITDKASWNQGGGLFSRGLQLGRCTPPISGGNINDAGLYIRSESIVRDNIAQKKSACNDIYPIFGWKEEESQ